MFLKITKRKYKERIIEHAKIVEGYREENTVKHRTLLNLGTIKTKEDRRRFNQILKSMKDGNNEFIKKENFFVKNAKEYGITYTTNELLKKYSLDEVLKKYLSDNKATFNVFSTIKALIINRLIRPSSELSTYDWIQNDYSENIKIKEHQIYRALDYLISKKEDIEVSIFETLQEKLNLNTNLVHYDLTSSYLEGKKCEIALYGYSRDKRNDRKQVVIGLVMCDGIPIYHEVYDGNTVDKTTLKGIVEKLREKFNLKDVVTVADRGLITKENLELLEKENHKYILGVQRRNNNLAKKYLTKEIESKLNQFAKIVGEEKIKRGDKEYIRKYILCIDNNTKKERLSTLKSIKENIEMKLKLFQEKYLASQKKKKGKKISKESIINQVSKTLGKNKRLFNLDFEGGFKFSLNKENYKYEKDIAGKFLLVTNTDIDAVEAMKRYKELQTVENAFDELKNFIDVRPIYHWKDGRVRAHIFICVLSFLIESIIEKFSDESARKVLKKLERMKVVEMQMGNNIKKKITNDSLIEIGKIFRKLKVNSFNFINL
jgi:transposase